MPIKGLQEILDQSQDDSQSGDEPGQGSLELRRSSVEGRAGGSRSSRGGRLDRASHWGDSRRGLNGSRSGGLAWGRNNDSRAGHRGWLLAALSASHHGSDGDSAGGSHGLGNSGRASDNSGPGHCEY